MNETRTKPKVYLLCTGLWGREDQAWMAVADDGEVLAQHISSNREWGLHDVGPTGFHRKDYEAKYGPGFDVEIVEVPHGENVPAEVLERNKTRYPEEWAKRGSTTKAGERS